MKVDERCTCGATFQASGMGAARAAAIWRVTHPCPKGNGAQWFTKVTVGGEDNQ